MRAWFDSLLPIGIVIIVVWVLVDILGLDIYNIIQGIFMR